MKRLYQFQGQSGLQLGTVYAVSATAAREQFARDKGYADWRTFCQETRTTKAEFDGAFRFILG